MRRFIIDTDTGSDDVWAIIEALRCPAVRVEAITTVCGNLPLELCGINAIHACDAAGTYHPPVYRGMGRPLLREEAFYAKNVHGEDGLSDMHLPTPERGFEKLCAMDAITELCLDNPGEIEIVTCGPLTNIAMAMLRCPELAASIGKMWILGGSGGDVGNMTPAAEYNIYCDPESAYIVLHSGVNATWVTWDAFRDGGELSFAEAEELGRRGKAAEFCVRCTEKLREYYRRKYSRDSFGVVDSVVMTAALFPEICSERYAAECDIDLAPGANRGHFTADPAGKPNTEVCSRVDTKLYKEKLFSLLGDSQRKN